MKAVDPGMPVADLVPLQTLLRSSLMRPRLLSLLLIVFAAAGLAVVMSGVYGVAAYGARRREREFGIRLAIGATPDTIWKLVVRQGLWQAMAGLAIGVPASLLAAGTMRSLLFGISARDVTTFVLLSGAIAVTTIAATLVPAARALRVTPAAVLRAE